APGVTPPTQPHDRYSAVLDVQQMIWDGGGSQKRSELEKHSQIVNQLKVAVNLYELKDQVNEVFFSILLLEQRLKSMDIIANELKERLNLLKSRVDAGVILSTQMDILKLEMLKVQQSVFELKQMKKSAFEMLEILTATELSGSEILIMDDLTSDEIRPELLLFDAQIK